MKPYLQAAHPAIIRGVVYRPGSMRLRRPLLHRFRLVAAVLFWPLLALVVWGEIWAKPLHLEAHNGDKLLHFLAYFGLATIMAMAVKRRSTAAASAGGLILLGGLLEIVQSHVGRDVSAADALANAAGAIAGGVLGRVIVEPLRRRFAGAGSKE
jgi:VanZ family protein